MHVFNFLSEKEQNKHDNNNIDISSFQNGLNNLFSSTGFYLKSKVIEGNYKGENMFFNFRGNSSQNFSYIFKVVKFLLAQWLSNQLSFSVAVHIYKILVFDKAFFFLLTIKMPMINKTFLFFLGGDMLRGALTHRYV